MAIQDSNLLSRRSVIAAGLTGAAACGLAAWGALPAIAEEAAAETTESTAASIDLNALSDDELTALEGQVSAEKARRGVNSAPLPVGQYTVGVDLDAGTYLVTPAEADAGTLTIHFYASLSSWQSGESPTDYIYIHAGESGRIVVEEGTAFTVDDYAGVISPAKKITFGESADEAATDQSATTDSSDVTPEFKEFMDSYETFMNGYCDFMKNYNDTAASGDATALANMLGDLSNLTQREAEWLDKINAVDQSTLSTADLNYYIEVTTRISQRLLETSASL